MACASSSPGIDAAQLAHWRGWVGRTEQRTDLVCAAPLNAWSATLDREDPEAGAGSEMPPLAHWMLFAPAARQSLLGPDGHPARGGFMPPIPLPRRMWAGSRLQFREALRVGDVVTRTSRIASVDAKSGRSGALAFVTVQHEVACPRGVAISEEHDIVYRAAPQPDAPATPPQTAPVDAAFSRDIVPDPVLLFRYSALTFNGHRIHYDRRYVTEVEGYPGLIVHGPLIATLLIDLLRRQQPDAVLRRFQFTAVRPLFDIHPLRVCGRHDDGADAERHTQLWACDHEGFLAMRASASWA
jgi:3-methylfumaryl-CoA hydratase